MKRSSASRDWLRSAVKQPKPATITNAVKPAIDGQKVGPLGIRAVTTSDIPQHWIGPAYQSDVDLLWRLHG